MPRDTTDPPSFRSWLRVLAGTKARIPQFLRPKATFGDVYLFLSIPSFPVLPYRRAAGLAKPRAAQRDCQKSSSLFCCRRRNPRNRAWRSRWLRASFLGISFFNDRSIYLSFVNYLNYWLMHGLSLCAVFMGKVLVVGCVLEMERWNGLCLCERERLQEQESPALQLFTED